MRKIEAALMDSPIVYFQFKPYYNKLPGETALLKDIIDLTSPAPIKEQIDSIVIFPNGISGSTRVSAIQVIRLITSKTENIILNLIGDSAILYEPKQTSKGNPLFTFLKVAFAFVLLFVGSALAIMYFHADVNMNHAHEMVYYLISGERVNRPYLLSVSYSIGIGIGIAVFFNVFNIKGKRNNPGPLELELFEGEKELKDYLVHLEGKEES